MNSHQHSQRRNVQTNQTLLYVMQIYSMHICSPFLSPARSHSHPPTQFKCILTPSHPLLSPGHHFLSSCQFEIYPSGPILRCNRILCGAPDSDFFTFRLLNKSITKALNSLLPKWQSRTKKMMMWMMIIIKAFRNLATSSSLVGTRSVDLTIKWI